MRMTFRHRLIATGLALALAASRSDAQIIPPLPGEDEPLPPPPPISAPKDVLPIPTAPPSYEYLPVTPAGAVESETTEEDDAPVTTAPIKPAPAKATPATAIPANPPPTIVPAPKAAPSTTAPVSVPSASIPPATGSAGAASANGNPGNGVSPAYVGPPPTTSSYHQNHNGRRGGRWRDRCTPEAAPLGYFANQHAMTQALNGIAARMMLYDYDFECGSEQLNLRGKDRLKQMAHWLNTTPFCLVIERMPHRPGLAESRRLAVLREFVQVPGDRIIVGPAPLGQLTGTEAMILYQNMLHQTERAGESTPGGGIIAGQPTTQPQPRDQ